VDAEETVRCYAVRRVNPFVGLLQIIETRDGRAISANGVVWELELTVVVASNEWGALNRNNSNTLYHRCGMWSQAEGLVRYPLPPRPNSDSLDMQARMLIEQIREESVRLPFRLEDNRELWIFDQQGKIPLALLASTAPSQQPPHPSSREWKASTLKGSPGQMRFPDAARLETFVKQRAGFNLKRYWITRLDDGSGVMANNNARIEAQHFPAFLLTQEWADGEQRRLACDFVVWTAPALLTLQRLSTSERAYLKQNLSTQAHSIEHHWRLYPQILDKDHLKAARVQCRLQNANLNHQVSSMRAEKPHG
jgi:hypothetical protein